MEVIRDTRLLGAEDCALLLSDDRDAQRLVVLDPDRTILLSTWDFLQQAVRDILLRAHPKKPDFG